MKILGVILFLILLLIVIKRTAVLSFVARLKFARGDMKKAIGIYALANRIGKLKPEHMYYYGYLLLRDGQLELARRTLTLSSFEAKNKDLKNKIKSMLAVAEWKSGNLDEAIEMTEEVLAEYKTTNIYQNLGLMYVIKGDAKKAVEFNEEAFDYNSDDMIIMDNLAESYAIAGEVDKATELYEKLLEKEPHFPEPYYGYGLLLAEKGEKDRAIELIEKSLEKRFSFLSVMQKEEVEKLLERIRNN